MAMFAACRHSRGTTSKADIARKFGISQNGLAMAVIRMEKRLNASLQLREHYHSIRKALTPQSAPP